MPHLVAVVLVQVVKVLRVYKAEVFLLFRVKASAELIENVEPSLVSILHDNTRLFQKEVAHLASNGLTGRETNLNILSLEEFGLSFRSIKNTHCPLPGVLTNLDELLFLTVLAFPNASRSGLDCMMTSLVCWAF